MKKIYLVLFSFLLLVTCTKEQITSRPYPRVETLSVTNVTVEGASFQGNITFSTGEIANTGFVWSLNENPTVDNSDSLSIGTQSLTGSFSATVTRSLLPGLKYYVRAFVKTNNYFVYGEVAAFMSLGSVSPYSITNVSPSQHLMPRQRVNVIGNFPADFQVKVDGKIVNQNNISNVTPGKFSLLLPDSTRNLSSVSVFILGHEVKSSQKLSLYFSYKSRKAWPFSLRTSKYSNCVIGGKNYFGFGSSNDNIIDSLFSYDPNTDVVTPILQPTIPKRFLAMSFSINGVAYFGGGLDVNGGRNDFYSFNPSTNVITRLADLPTPDGTNGVSYNENYAISGFTINGRGYCMVHLQSPSIKNELYEFNPASNTWEKKADYPGYVQEGIYSYSLLFEQNGIAYIGTIGSLWGFDPSSNTWSSIKFNYNLEGVGINYTFNVLNANGKTYLILFETDYSDLSYSTNFYEFLPDSKTFKLLPFATTVPFNSLSGAFSLGGTAYFYSGSAVWEFDPNR